MGSGGQNVRSGDRGFDWFPFGVLVGYLWRDRISQMAEELDYIPMPEPVVKLIEKTWSTEIKS
jgi:hypothetical protein